MKSVWIFCVLLGICHLLTPIECILPKDFLIEDHEYIENSSKYIIKGFDIWSFITNNFTDMSRCSRAFHNSSLKNILISINESSHEFENIYYNLFTNIFTQLESYKESGNRTLNLTEYEIKYNLKMDLVNQEKRYFYGIVHSIDFMKNRIQIITKSLTEECKDKRTETMSRNLSEVFNTNEDQAELEKQLAQVIVSTIRQVIKESNNSINKMQKDYRKYVDSQTIIIYHKTIDLCKIKTLRNLTQCLEFKQELPQKNLRSFLDNLKDSCLKQFLIFSHGWINETKEIEIDSSRLDQNHLVSALRPFWKKNIHAIKYESDRRTRNRMSLVEHLYFECVGNGMAAVKKISNRLDILIDEHSGKNKSGKNSTNGPVSKESQFLMIFE